MHCSSLFAFFLLLVLYPFSNATCSCSSESLSVAIKGSSRYVFKAKVTAVTHSSGTASIDIKVLQVWKPCKVSFKEIVVTAKSGDCGASFEPSTTYLFVGDLDFISGSTHYVTISSCSYAKVFSKLIAAELKLLPALRKALKCRPF